MILPGHIAASFLCCRYLKADLPLALVAGILPDIVDKALFYATGLTPNSRVPCHTLLAWLVTSLLILLAGLLIQHSWNWGYTWGLAYGVHLLCDSPLVGGELPFLYPFRAYDFGSPDMPLGFLFGLETWPASMLLAEVTIVLAVIILELTYRRKQSKGMQQT